MKIKITKKQEMGFRTVAITAGELRTDDRMSRRLTGTTSEDGAGIFESVYAALKGKTFRRGDYSAKLDLPAVVSFELSLEEMHTRLQERINIVKAWVASLPPDFVQTDGREYPEC